MADLEQTCKNYFNLVDSDKISLAKYFPHKFEWMWLNPNEEITEKKKKGKEVKYLAANADLKKMPFMLKDGDIIGIRFDSEIKENESDDF